MEYGILMFCAFLFACIRKEVSPNIFIIFQVFLPFLFILFIGLRFEIGTDWYNYLDYFNHSNEGGFFESLLIGDPGYVLLNRLSKKIGGGIYLVNTFAAFSLIVPLVIFCQRFKLVGFAFFLAIPYVLIIVGMGYTRQSIALGFEIAALCFALNSHFRLAFFWIFLATLFHKTALVLFPIFIIGFNLLGFGTILITVVIGFCFYFILESQFSNIISLYVKEQLASSGAHIRVLFNAVPAFLLFLFKNFKHEENYKFWRLLAIMSIASILLVDVFPVAVDRVIIYFFPIQIFVFVNIIKYTFHHLRGLVFFSIIIIYAFYIFIWLNFGAHSAMWIPYRSLFSLFR